MKLSPVLSNCCTEKYSRSCGKEDGNFACTDVRNTNTAAWRVELPPGRECGDCAGSGVRRECGDCAGSGVRRECYDSVLCVRSRMISQAPKATSGMLSSCPMVI